MKRALITGIAGQDGSYLAELLLGKGYKVFGLTLAGELLPAGVPALGKVTVIPGDLCDQDSVDEAVKVAAPDEVYNFAAQSDVPLSWKEPAATGEVTGLGAVRLFDAVLRHAPKARVFHASSCAIFGSSPAKAPQDEDMPIRPDTPYGAAKAYAHAVAVMYRKTHGLHISCGIFFNHESPRRPERFAARKVTLAVARIKAGLQKELKLGDLDAVRDWAFAGDFVQAAWLMLQQERPDDYVIAGGKSRTVRELVATAFESAGFDWTKYVVHDGAVPESRVPIVGDASKARKVLGWEPRVSFRDMIESMVRSDYDAMRAQPLLGSMK